MSDKYLTILADPPWPLKLTGKYNRRREHRAMELPYKTMTVDDIKHMPIAEITEGGCHLWLWTTNQHLHDGFHVLEAWGFKYLAPITIKKPSGCGNYFIHLTQTVLFGYKNICHFPLKRFLPTYLETGTPARHSEKPAALQDYIEMISPGPRLELFARRKRMGWDVWGNEVESDIDLGVLQNPVENSGLENPS